MESLFEIPLEGLYWYVGALDSVPEYVRALIAAALLVVFLRLSHSRVPDRDVQFSISFCKVSLIALMIVPPVIWLLPGSRLVVFVDELEPARQTGQLAWLVLAGLWGMGVAVGVLKLAYAYGRAARAFRSLAALPEDHKLALRLRHWQRRLGNTRRLTLVLTGNERPEHLAGVRRLALPAAVLHWPAAAQDLVIIHELCRNTRHHGRWHLFSQLVACCYWPLPWVRVLHARLLADFEVVTSRLAEACYQDELGYRRALRQIEQRLSSSRPPARPAVPEAFGGRRPTQIRRALWKPLASLWSARPCLDWSMESLTRARQRRDSALWAEPGEKLMLLIGQAAFVAFLIGGVTLKEVPPRVERDFTITLDESWMGTFYRDRERAEMRSRLGRGREQDRSR